MSEVIGAEAKTLHRLLEWAPEKGGFKRDDKTPLDCDFLIVDETSMLDISLAASLLKAVPPGAQAGSTIKFLSRHILCFTWGYENKIGYINCGDDFLSNLWSIGQPMRICRRRELTDCP
jgi:hypothetical protein